MNNMKKLGFMIVFVVGALLAGTANLQLTIGAVLLVIGYNEFRKQGISLDKIDDEILAEISKFVSKNSPKSPVIKTVKPKKKTAKKAT